MKWSMMLLLLLLLPSVLAVRIEEVYYDPVGSESGGEAVLLYQEANASVDISGWLLSTETSEQDVTLPSGTVLQAFQYYLITDVGWDEEKDSEDFSSAHHEEAMTLGNTDAGVALVNTDNETVDAVGWGNVHEIDDGLYLQVPAEDVEEGKSLLRINNTGINSIDFVSSIPQLKTLSKNTSQQGIQFEIIVSDYLVTLDNFSFLSDDFDDVGVQLIPTPGQERKVGVRAFLTHELNASLLPNASFGNVSLTEVEVLNATTAVYEGNLSLGFTQQPGNYTQAVTVGTAEENYTYEIMSVTALALDVDRLTVEAKAREVDYLITGDEDMSTLTQPTIRNIGNVDLNIGVQGDSFLSVDEVLQPSIVRYTFNGNFNGLLAGNVSNQLRVVPLDLSPGAMNDLGFSVRLPSVVGKGTYSGTITISGVKA